MVSDRPAHLHLDFRYALLTDTPEALHAGAGESAAFAWLTPDDVARATASAGAPPSGDYAIGRPLARLIGKAVRLFTARCSAP